MAAPVPVSASSRTGTQFDPRLVEIICDLLEPKPSRAAARASGLRPLEAT